MKNLSLFVTLGLVTLMGACNSVNSGTPTNEENPAADSSVILESTDETTAEGINIQLEESTLEAQADQTPVVDVDPTAVDGNPTIDPSLDADPSLDTTSDVNAVEDIDPNSGMGYDDPSAIDVENSATVDPNDPTNVIIQDNTITPQIDDKSAGVVEPTAAPDGVVEPTAVPAN